MNELQARRLLVEALNGSGPIGNDRDFWTTVLTALNGGVFSSANNEHEFWGKFATGIANYQPPIPSNQAVVTDGDILSATGGTVTITVVNNVATAEFNPE